MNLKILALGDIVGENTASALCNNISAIRREYGVHLVVANGENVCLGSGNGLSAEWAVKLLSSGIDVLTLGNHAYRQRCLYNLLDDRKDVIRPANFPANNPGVGHTIFDCGIARVLVINISGQQHLWYENAPSSPFDAVEAILAETEGQYDLSVLDIHAETTSEKITLALHFDGVIDVIFGTHTHVQTADQRILPKGTAFITDLGMCGVLNSSLGVEFPIVLKRFRTGMPQKFTEAKGEIDLCGAVFEIKDGVSRVDLFRKRV